MKVRVQRASPHQNGKVFGLLMAATSLIFVIPMFVAVQFVPVPAGAEGDQINLPPFVFLFFPVAYLVFGYIGGAVSCLVYNLIARVVGGFAFEIDHPQ